MKKLLTAISAMALIASSFASDADKSLTPKSILNTLEKTLSWHIDNPTNTKLDIQDWEIAPYYDGLICLSKFTGNPKYWAEVIRMGDASGWAPRYRKWHADDHAICHAWLDTYSADTSKKYRLDFTKKMVDTIIEDAKTWGGKKKLSRFGGQPEFLYEWCDALYMSPPVLARLYKITGDVKYRDHLDTQYKKCFDLLYSAEDALFYRDASYIGKKTKNGKRVFWGRGNGWVMGGFAQILPYLSKEDSSYTFYTRLFKDMSEKLLTLQLDDGMWGVSLIDPDEFGEGETSSTCFIAYGLAWGVNNGLLDREKFTPAIVKAWNALVKKCVLESGKLVYVQPVGEKPDKFSAETSNPYGVGAFSLFGCELAKILGAQMPNISDRELVSRAEALNDSATPRAVILYEPRRADDIAWENDKVAFRAYGPALEKSIENSGVDLWFKHVAYPALKRAYKAKFEKNQDYHKDNGEIYDTFKVADTVGCGGTGIWLDGKLYTANVYKVAQILWTTPDVASVRFTYEYNINGKKILEKKTVTIRTGDNFCTVTSCFHRGKKLFKDMDVAFGILPQTKDYKLVMDTVSKDIVTADKVDGKTLTMFARLAKDLKLVAFKKYPTSRGDEILAIAKTDKNGCLRYTFGFDWK